ncbi:MAG: hypothetical protein ACI4EG_14090 [Fusicatenibacter sp.]
MIKWSRDWSTFDWEEIEQKMDAIQSGRTDVELGITREEFQEYLGWLNIHEPELFDTFLALQQLKAAEEQLYEKEKDRKN